MRAIFVRKGVGEGIALFTSVYTLILRRWGPGGGGGGGGGGGVLCSISNVVFPKALVSGSKL